MDTLAARGPVPVDGKLPQISDYRELIAKLLDQDTNERLLDKLGQHPEQVGRLMKLF